MEEEFIRYRGFEDANFVPMYLDCNIKLWANELFMDGTWSVARNVRYRQIYIFSINFQHLQKTFNMPVLYIFMQKKSKNNYNEIFAFMKRTYYAKMGKELGIPFFMWIAKSL